MNEEKTPSRIFDLDSSLASLREGQAADKRIVNVRRDTLLSGWTKIAPLLDAAVGRVNVVLAKHGYTGIDMDAPNFNSVDESSYGAPGSIPGINYGDLLVVLSDEMILYVNANCGGHWSEGHAIAVQDATVERIAEALAAVAKDLITEEPA